MNNFLQLKKQALKKFLEDWVALWEVIRLVKRKYPTYTSKEVKELTLQLILELLNEGFIIAGFPQKDGSFIQWKGNPIEQLNKIRAEWDSLNKEPNIGDIAWFDITDIGQKALQTFLEE